MPLNDNWYRSSHLQSSIIVILPMDYAPKIIVNLRFLSNIYRIGHIPLFEHKYSYYFDRKILFKN